MGWYHDGSGWGAGWLVMLFGMAAFWGLVVWAIVVLFRDSRSRDAQSRDARPAHQDPLDVLDERFARGEIDETEYRARADLLRATRH